jgi:hypothetical protein
MRFMDECQARYAHNHSCRYAATVVEGQPAGAQRPCSRRTAQAVPVSGRGVPTEGKWPSRHRRGLFPSIQASMSIPTSANRAT